MRLGTEASPKCPVCSQYGGGSSIPWAGDCGFVPVLVDVTIPTGPYAGTHTLHVNAGTGTSGLGWKKHVSSNGYMLFSLANEGWQSEAVFQLATSLGGVWRAPYTPTPDCNSWDDWEDLDLDLTFDPETPGDDSYLGTTVHVASHPFREPA